MISSTVLAKAQWGRGEGGRPVEETEQGVKSPKIAPRHRGLERKEPAVLHRHSSGRYFFCTVLLSHSLLMFSVPFKVEDVVTW